MLSEIEGKEIECNQKGLEQLKEKMVKYDGAKFLKRLVPLVRVICSSSCHSLDVVLCC